MINKDFLIIHHFDLARLKLLKQDVHGFRFSYSLALQNPSKLIKFKHQKLY